jgi:hypothetical protein
VGTEGPQRILSKLDVHSRTEAVALAYREGLTKGGAALPVAPMTPITR